MVVAVVHCNLTVYSNLVAGWWFRGWWNWSRFVIFCYFCITYQTYVWISECNGQGFRRGFTAIYIWTLPFYSVSLVYSTVTGILGFYIVLLQNHQDESEDEFLCSVDPLDKVEYNLKSFLFYSTLFFHSVVIRKSCINSAFPIIDCHR